MSTVYEHCHRVGKAKDGSEVYVRLTDPWHIAVQGMSRSGKSVFTQNLLASCAYAPEIVVCGMDPTGILFNPWRDHPHLEWRASGGRDMEAHLRAMEGVLAEMDARIEGLLDQDLDKLGAPTPETPLLLFVCEEFPGLKAQAKADDAAKGRKPVDRLVDKIDAGFLRLCQESAKVNVRVLVICQRMDVSILGSGAARSNLGTAATFRVDRKDAVDMLHADIDKDLVLEVRSFPPGRGLFEGVGVDLTVFRSDFLDYADYVRIVRDAGARRLGGAA